MKRQRDSARKRGDRVTARNMLRRMRTLPSRDPMDPGYRRLRYSRYADDNLLGFTGPKAKPSRSRAELTRFLRETLRLELNQDKTLISHARTQPARFLGYHIIVQHCYIKITRGRRAANGAIALRVPPDVIKAKTTPYRRRANPAPAPAAEPGRQRHRPGLRSRVRGRRELLPLARDVWRLSRLCWYAETSMLKTLAAKHKSTVTKMAARYKAKVITGDGPRTCFEARLQREGKKDLVARFGGIPLGMTGARSSPTPHRPGPATPARN